MKKAKAKLRKDSMFKTETKVPVQSISPSKTVKSANGIEYSLGALSPFSIRASGFKVTVDGEEIPSASLLWSGTAFVILGELCNEAGYDAGGEGRLRDWEST
jgi:hypothetical protein